MSQIKLPRAESSLGHPLEMLLAQRRTVREFASKPVSLTQASAVGGAGHD